MTSPTLVFIHAEGCPACAEAKPHFKKLVAELPSWKTGMLDLDKPGVNLDFPVQYTPTLYVQIGQKRYATDPFLLKRSLTYTSMKLWLEAVVQKYRSGA